MYEFHLWWHKIVRYLSLVCCRLITQTNGKHPKLEKTCMCIWNRVQGGGGGGVKNVYELLTRELLKLHFSTNCISYIFKCMGTIFFVEIQRVSFEIPRRISRPYIERCDFYSVEHLIAPRFTSSCAFLRCPLVCLWYWLSAKWTSMFY